ncbi:hypothetical protein RKD41_000005 [Streptomyces tendae]
MWAKHDRDSDGWLPLWRHMEDSAAVAGLLWDQWLPSGVRRLVAEALPQGELDARALAVWLAGVHDIGKATPAFACQVDQLADTMRDQGLGLWPEEMQAWIAAVGWTSRGRITAGIALSTMDVVLDGARVKQRLRAARPPS